MIENLKIRPAAPSDADEILAIRRDAILSLADGYGRDAAERWANAAAPDRATRAIGSNAVWVAELDAKIAGWVEVSGATIESLYVAPVAMGQGIGSTLLAQASSRSTMRDPRCRTSTRARMRRPSMRVAVTSRPGTSSRTTRFR
ncbi:GNAT family N-acetyltransferase [Candidatus Binatia bacterium]|nr:GNAT family N-acetyltransferase [Candidatus Binatia bacterium]